MKNEPLDDNDREQWIDNDEGLYDMQRQSGMTMRKFINHWRAEIVEYIDNVRSGRKQAHYGKYGS